MCIRRSSIPLSLSRDHLKPIAGTPFANMDETYQYFKSLVLKHSLFVSADRFSSWSKSLIFRSQRPPYSLRVFTPDVTKKVTDYIVDTYFRHYKMYKYVFTPTVSPWRSCSSHFIFLLPHQIDLNVKFVYEGEKQETLKEEEAVDESVAHVDKSEQQHGTVWKSGVYRILRSFYRSRA